MGKYLRKSPFWFFAAFLLFTLIATVVAAAEVSPAAKVDTGDTAWLLTSAALVLLMTPALAFFYGHMSDNHPVGTVRL